MWCGDVEEAKPSGRRARGGAGRSIRRRGAAGPFADSRYFAGRSPCQKQIGEADWRGGMRMRPRFRKERRWLGRGRRCLAGWREGRTAAASRQVGREVSRAPLGVKVTSDLTSGGGRSSSRGARAWRGDFSRQKSQIMRHVAVSHVNTLYSGRLGGRHLSDALSFLRPRGVFPRKLVYHRLYMYTHPPPQAHGNHAFSEALDAGIDTAAETRHDGAPHVIGDNLGCDACATSLAASPCHQLGIPAPSRTPGPCLYACAASNAPDKFPQEIRALDALAGRAKAKPGHRIRRVNDMPEPPDSLFGGLGAETSEKPSTAAPVQAQADGFPYMRLIPRKTLSHATPGRQDSRVFPPSPHSCGEPIFCPSLRAFLGR